MRIDIVNKINNLYQSNTTQKTTKTNSTKKVDQLEISQVGKDYQVAKQSLNKVQDVRLDKVNEIKNRMNAGTYQVSLEEVADKLINNYFDTIV